MPKTFVLAVALALTVVTLQAEEKATTKPGEIVHLSKSDAGPTGYLSLPNGTKAGRPAIILIQEWWGLTDWLKQCAERYAAQGYVVLAPDLYRGKVANDADEAHQLMRGLPDDRAMGDMKAAFDYLATRGDVDPKRIAIVGWCMGGGYALAFGVEEPRLAALVINYGRLITDPGKVAKIKAPVQGNFGSIDKGIPSEDVLAFEKSLTEAGIANDFKIFEGAGHGFMNPNNSKGYNEAAAKSAWTRMDGFLAKHLRGE